MREFFRGWRRKMGCVTLVMACLMGVAWGRSHVITDRIEVPGLHSGSECKSYPGYISWTWRSPSDQFEKIRWTSAALSNWREIDIWTYNDPHFDWNWGGIKFGSVSTGRWSEHQGEDSRRGEIRTHFRVVYYWVLVLPLTLLSAYLILWKPRQRAPQGEIDDGIPRRHRERSRSSSVAKATFFRSIEGSD